MADDRYGTKVRLRGMEYNIAPLTKRQLERLWPKIVAIQQAMNGANFGDLGSTDMPMVMRDVCEIVLAGLQGGGNPDARLEQVEDLIDISNFGEAWIACLRVSNIRMVPGKAPALVESRPTGSESTGT